MLLVKHASHLRSFNNQQSGRRNRASRPHANRLASHASLAKKVAGTKNGHNGLFADRTEHGELYAAPLIVKDRAGRLTLSVDARGSLKLDRSSLHTSRIEKGFGVKSGVLLGFHGG